MARTNEGSFVPACLTQSIVEMVTASGFAADTDVSCRYVEQSKYIEAEIDYLGQHLEFLFPHDIDHDFASMQVIHRLHEVSRVVPEREVALA